MKKLNIGVLALSGIVFLNSCGATKTTATETKTETAKVAEQVKEEVKEEGINLSYMDKNVRPQDDFFSYVNGNWVKTTQIPSDKANWGSFNALRENVDDASLDILNKILTESYSAGSEGEKIQNLYASFMDTAKRNAEGLAPIKGDLAKIDAIKNINDLQKYLLEATKLGDNSFYGWRVGADMKNSKMNAVYLGGPDLGLGRDYYQKVNEANTKTLAEYQAYAGKLFGVLGYKNSTQAAQNVVDFEKQLANYLLTLEQNRDANLRYNPKNVSELSGLVKNVDLAKYLKEAGVNTDRVIIGELKYYQNMDQFVTQKNLPLLKDYLKFHLINGNASNLDDSLEQIRFDFYAKYLQGQKEQRPMNKRGLTLVNGVLGEAFGKLYVEKYFTPEAKQQMETYIDYLLKSFKSHIAGIDWMSPETKVKAQEKLSKFTVKIAYPDKWKDYTQLKVESPKQGATLYSNLQNVAAWQYQRSLDKVGKPVDKTEWGMSPQTVNAYYSGSNNEIVFPAAILQPPFYNPNADAAVNFGGIGAVIGHEISHGFDDSGSRFDGDGNLNNWWTDADRKNFDAKVGQLAAQYSAYEPVKGSFVNGKFTSGENIGDLGGVAVAYDALQMYLKDKGNPGKISGFTQDQRFFMSWATVWRTKATDQYMINQVKTDPHSPGMYRAFGPLVNQDSFIKAFDIKPGDKMYKAPQDRIKIW
ncbi:M13 family peptidase [Chryseobacterium indologenes]|uniref:M13 family peptidase n=1 Tax=Chryseobacterium indologenes TaxID=253 RepID=A0AAD0Z316_CHRID|nr:M13 family metallopeptidase [Chryseobacterium indologenes]ASE60181.1 M13 family peptidase [Chryseobacterium indologenes]ATN04357.1 endothelin-converting protein [Chryseobacterium indologenes]AYY86893.1 M13 family peptidase [Chryseobacterium indologenes]AYZ36784.1 M13 family peptidase [Chryseobacterium indologenes]AZB20079.1 M13 family peptidase [Chryseobacterium indologenes]